MTDIINYFNLIKIKTSIKESLKPPSILFDCIKIWKSFSILIFYIIPVILKLIRKVQEIKKMNSFQV